MNCNEYAGIRDKSVLATMTAGANTWEILTGVTPSFKANSAAEVYVEVFGSTTGYVWVDSWSAS